MSNIVKNSVADLQGLLNSEKIRKRFDEVLGAKATVFASSLISVARNTKALKDADPMSIITAGMMAATMDLPVGNLGYAYIVPFKNKKTGECTAQFVMGYKGYQQLAYRSGQYLKIEAHPAYEGEVRVVNRFTGDVEFGERTSDTIVGYLAFFRLKNGFEKFVYMTIEEVQEHARKYSKTYKGGTETWGLTDFHTMATKTVMRRLLSKYGILSIEMQDMQRAMECDGAVIKEDKNGVLVPSFEHTENADVIEIDASNTDSPVKISPAEAVEEEEEPNDSTSKTEAPEAPDVVIEELQF